MQLNVLGGVSTHLVYNGLIRLMIFYNSDKYQGYHMKKCLLIFQFHYGYKLHNASYISCQSWQDPPTETRQYAASSYANKHPDKTATQKHTKTT